MDKNKLISDAILIFNGPGNRRLKLKIANIQEDYLQLEVLESELPSKKIGALFRVPLFYVLESGLYGFEDLCSTPPAN